MLALVVAGCGRIGFGVGDGQPGRDGAAAAIALVQDNTSQLYMGVGNASVSFAMTPGSGSFVWVSIATYEGAVTSVGDNQGNGYAQAFSSEFSPCGKIGVQGFFASNVRASDPFTVAITGSGIWATHLREYSGVGAFGPSSTATGAGALADSGPVTSAEPGAVYIAAQTHCNTSVTSAGTGWSNHVVTTEDQAYQALSTEDMIAPGPGTYRGQFGYSLADPGWTVGIAAFLPR